MGATAMALKLTLRGGKYYLRGTVRGTPVYETTGTDDKKTADQIRIKREAELLKESIHGRIATLTFAQAASSFIDSGGSPRFLGKLDETTGKWGGLIGLFYDRVIDTITQSDLDAAADKLYPGTQYNTRNRQCHAPFIAVFNHAVRNKWAQPRAWARPRKPKGTMLKFSNKPKRAGTTATTYERAAQFVLAMSPGPAMLMTTFFYTGMRPIELFTLEAEQVNVADRWITLPETKSGEPRGVPMHEILVPLFTGLMRRGGFLFRTPRGAAYAPKDEPGAGGGQMKTAINGARKRSGITNIAPYTGRHTVSSQLVMNGVHTLIKDVILGHANDDGDMTRRYTHITPQKLVEAINTLPVIDAWASAPWMHDPLAWASKLAAGTGQRTDLTEQRKAA
jgi:integrase/recombinase XerD